MQGISRWRIALVASALVVLGALGVGLVLANDPSDTGATGGPPAGAPPGAGPGDGLGLPGLGLLDPGGPGAAPAVGTGPARPATGPRIAARGLRLQRVVHLEGTLDLPNRGIVKVAFDHGTIAALGDGTISVLEKDGQTVTLKTDAETRVRKGGSPATLGDLKKGDEVVVTSRLEDGSYVAYRIIVPPARPAAGTTP